MMMRWRRRKSLRLSGKKDRRIRVLLSQLQSMHLLLATTSNMKVVMLKMEIKSTNVKVPTYGLWSKLKRNHKSFKGD
jgi:hypothetical protein